MTIKLSVKEIAQNCAIGANAHNVYSTAPLSTLRNWARDHFFLMIEPEDEKSMLFSDEREFVREFIAEIYRLNRPEFDEVRDYASLVMQLDLLDEIEN